MNGWKLVPVEPDQIHQMAFEEGQPAENGDGYMFTAEEFDLFVDRLLTAAAPVLPADGEPGAVKGLRQLVIGPYPDPDVEDAHDEYLDEHQSQALWLLRNAGRIEAHVTRLTAERDGLKDENDTLEHHVIDLKLANSHLQSELTKARELLSHMQTYSNKYPTSPIGEYKNQIAEVLTHQSAPAAKGGSDE